MKRSFDLSTFLNIKSSHIYYEKTFVVLNDRLLTSQKDGLSNSLNLTNQDFYVRLVDEKNKVNNSVLAGRSFSRASPSRADFDFPPFLRPATQAKIVFLSCLNHAVISSNLLSTVVRMVSQDRWTYSDSQKLRLFSFGCCLFNKQ